MVRKQRETAFFQEACKRAGLRLTPQRLEIFRELAAAGNHPSAEELHRRLLPRFPSLSLDTVYRTLATFARHGFVHKLETAENQARFELRTTRHHHVICRSCKEIVDFQWSSFDAVPLPEEIQSWGRIENSSAVIYGICRTCERMATRTNDKGANK